MIDLHTHSLLSDGQLLPSELVRRAVVKGCRAIAITDHVDFSNIDFVIPRVVKACKMLNKYWGIFSIPGVEITHVPPRSISGLVNFARKAGAKIVVGHGETASEPVLQGTNRAFVEAGVDILAHPGKIEEKDVKLARSKKIFLEITTRKTHRRTNRYLLRLALKHRAFLVLNTDAHAPSELIGREERDAFLTSLGLSGQIRKEIVENSTVLLSRLRRKGI